jgi:hypothetical protein
MSNQSSLVDAWLTVQRNWWAYVEVREQIAQKPSAAWLTILALVTKADTPELLEDIGAGPLEDFLKLHGESFIEQLEHEAGTSKNLRDALGHVWLRVDENEAVPRLVGLGCQTVALRKDGTPV